MTKLVYSPESQKDLEGIKSYITNELCNVTAATNVLTRILKNVRRLQEYPELGAPLSSIVDIETDYRFLVCGNYVAFYKHEDKTVFVDRVLYGRRDFMKFLFSELLESE